MEETERRKLSAEDRVAIGLHGEPPDGILFKGGDLECVIDSVGHLKCVP